MMIREISLALLSIHLMSLSKLHVFQFQTYFSCVAAAAAAAQVAQYSIVLRKDCKTLAYNICRLMDKNGAWHQLEYSNGGGLI